MPPPIKTKPTARTEKQLLQYVRFFLTKSSTKWNEAIDEGRAASAKIQQGPFSNEEALRVAQILDKCVNELSLLPASIENRISKAREHVARFELDEETFEEHAQEIRKEMASMLDPTSETATILLKTMSDYIEVSESGEGENAPVVPHRAGSISSYSSLTDQLDEMEHRVPNLQSSGLPDTNSNAPIQPLATSIRGGDPLNAPTQFTVPSSIPISIPHSTSSTIPPVVSHHVSLSSNIPTTVHTQNRDEFISTSRMHQTSRQPLYNPFSNQVFPNSTYPASSSVATGLHGSNTHHAFSTPATGNQGTHQQYDNVTNNVNQMNTVFEANHLSQQYGNLSMREPLSPNLLNQIRKPSNSKKQSCECCEGAHELFMCDDPRLTRFCAINERCIKCTATSHKAVDCQLPAKAEQVQSPIPPQETMRGPQPYSPTAHQAGDGFANHQNESYQSFEYPRNTGRHQSTPKAKNPVQSEAQLEYVIDHHTTIQTATTLVPSFDGKQTGYRSFLREMKSMVLDNPKLSAAVKRNILKKKLEAAGSHCLSELNDPEDAIQETLRLLRREFGSLPEACLLRQQLRKIQFDSSNDTVFAKALNEARIVITQLQEMESFLDEQVTYDLIGKLPTYMQRKCMPIARKGEQDALNQVLDTAEDMHMNNRACAMVSYHSRNSEYPSRSFKFNKTPSVPVMIMDQQSEDSEYEEESPETIMAINHKTMKPKPAENIGLSQASAKPNSGNKKIKFLPDGTPDCPNKETGKRMTYEEALATKLSPGAASFVWNVGSGFHLRNLKFSLTRKYESQDLNCQLCGVGHKLIQCPKSSSNESNETIIKTIIATLSTSRIDLNCLNQKTEDVSLPFAIIETRDGHFIRALIDSGAAISLISDATAERIGLQTKQSTKITIEAFNNVSTHDCNIYQISINGKDHIYSTFVAGSPKLPKTKYKHSSLSEDDKFEMLKHGISEHQLKKGEEMNNREIEMILGNDILPHIMRRSKRILLPSGRYVESSSIANIVYPRARHCPIMSKGKDSQSPIIPVNMLTAKELTKGYKDNLTELISQLWNLENCGIESPTLLEQEHLDSESLLKLFEESLIVKEGGEIEVALPWNGKQNRLKDNKSVAFRRLESLIRQLRKNPTLLKEYNKIIDQQESAGIIEKVTPEMEKTGPHYYAPQSAVFKENSANTKVRIVSDTSSHVKNELSANDCVHEGPNMLNKHIGLHLRHRLEQYAITADIAKAFHQVRLQTQDRNVTKFLWVKNIELPPTGGNLITYRFTRIPFGMKCSPFLLAATIRHYLLLAANIISNEIGQNLYVDNIMVTTNDENQVLPKIRAIQDEFKKMNMHVREFGTNHETALLELPIEDRAESHLVKFLGYIWNTTDDTVSIHIHIPKETDPTKRELTSMAAKSYDPMGFTAPLHVRIKLLIQKCWKSNIDWDDKLSTDYALSKEWEKIKTLYCLEKITVPRKLRKSFNRTIIPEMITFCDASKHTFATAVYLLYRYTDGTIDCNIIGAKSKLKPPSEAEHSIPKSELSATDVGIRFSKSLIDEMPEGHKPKRIHIFTDSMIALFWILNKETKRAWVNNRVNTIHKTTESLREQNIEVVFHHVDTSQNPADLATRGLDTESLQKSTLWFNGPEFLKDPPETWKAKLEGEIECSESEKELANQELSEYKKPKKEKTSTVQNLQVIPIHLCKTLREQQAPKQPEAYKSFIPFECTNKLGKLESIAAYILHLIGGTMKSRDLTTPLMREVQKIEKIPDIITRSIERRQLARKWIILEHYKEAESQNQSFSESLKPFQTSDGLWRTKRYSQSPVLPKEANNPILIHEKHALAKLIMTETHEKNVHLPAQYLVAAVRSQYWIRKDGRLAQSVISRCVPCRKVKAFPYEYPYTSELPALRTTPSTPFGRVGIDYLGPIDYKNAENDNKRPAYVLIYTCLTTRATHLELVPDNTTRSYITALASIFSQRGVPTHVYSDNARTFVLGHSMVNEDIHNYDPAMDFICLLARHSIKFKYITPLSPWQGGVYERIVGIAKKQLRKEIGRYTLPYFDLYCTLKRVEGMINSRPLVKNPNTANDVPVIRPIDFLLPSVLLEIPNETDRDEEGDEYRINSNPSTEQVTRDHLNKLNKVLLRLWNVWINHYILTLRDSHIKSRRTSSKSRRYCPEVPPAPVRTVKVLFENSIKERSVNQLIPLELDMNDDQQSPQKTTKEEQEYRNPSIPQLLQPNHPTGRESKLLQPNLPSPGSGNRPTAANTTPKPSRQPLPRRAKEGYKPYRIEHSGFYHSSLLPPGFKLPRFGRGLATLSYYCSYRTSAVSLRGEDNYSNYDIIMNHTSSQQSRR
uniref:Integrase catalytic domain-containing protein n=1 Tax=Caenorhabditis tropicalis TaxID=1561998 RepID=A0A1I7T9M5_9PELO